MDSPASASIVGAKAIHFTYQKPEVGSSALEQGDILQKTPEICKLIEIVHPHYLKEDYSHFILLTQSCDLVPREGKCKARYLTLAAIRPFSLLLSREIQKEQKKELERFANVLSTGKRGGFVDFLQKLFNNNNSDYFYLHAEPALDFPEPSCAFLRLSIAIRAEEHYDKCLAARMFSLEDTFKAKLGWLVGDMYSRVGTDDWVPDYHTEQEFRALISNTLNESCEWVESTKLEKAAKSWSALGRPSMGVEEARKFIRETDTTTKKDRVLDRVFEVLGEFEILKSAELRKTITTRLGNDPVLTKELK